MLLVLFNISDVLGGIDGVLIVVHKAWNLEAESERKHNQSFGFRLDKNHFSASMSPLCLFKQKECSGFDGIIVLLLEF